MKHTYTEEEKERIAQMLFDFLREHRCFGGEHFAQDDTSQIDSIDFMCNLADIKDVVPPCKFKDGDERIRKALISVLKSDFENDTTIHDISVGDILSWLENQGKQKTIWHNEDEEPQRGRRILLIMKNGTAIVAKIIEPNHTFNHGERWAYIDDLLEKQGESPQGESALESINEEKVDNQNCVKPTDKVEPKFKVGDIIQDVDNYKVKITEIDTENSCYIYESVIAKEIGSINFSEQDNWKLTSNKFDISTLVPFESRVLVRDYNSHEWVGDIFTRYNQHSKECSFTTLGGQGWRQCIPYNDRTIHLLGSTSDCDEYYKTWE